MGMLDVFGMVGSVLSTESVGLDWILDTEALQVDNDGKNHDSRNEVHQVQQSLPPECLSQYLTLAIPGE